VRWWAGWLFAAWFDGFVRLLRLAVVEWMVGLWVFVCWFWILRSLCSFNFYFMIMRSRIFFQQETNGEKLGILI
jgi:hypothetical protein